jgi:hypothetical protein
VPPDRARTRRRPRSADRAGCRRDGGKLVVTAFTMQIPWRAVLLLFSMVPIVTACTPGDSGGRQSTGAGTAADVDTGVVYGRGFYDLERDAQQSWRWMGTEGTVVIPNLHANGRLRLSAGAPVDQAVIRIELNGEQLDEFTVKPGNFERDYVIAAARQGPFAASNVRIVTSAATQGPNDPRQLGLRVFDVAWAAE